MSSTPAIQTVKTLMTALQSGDMEVAANILSDNFIISGLFPKTLDKGEWLATQGNLLVAMPDFSYNLSELREENGEVVALINITGTHTDELNLPTLGLQPIPATGLAVALPQVQTTYKVKDGTVTALHVQSVPGGGMEGLLQQVGAELPLLSREMNIPD